MMGTRNAAMRTTIMDSARPTKRRRNGSSPGVEDQLTRCVLMIDPCGFCSNEETKVDNRFMGSEERNDVEPCVAAMSEWSSLVKALREAGVFVTTFTGQGLPDEVFPNNWFSTHADGKFVIYPMKVPSRRKEIRHDAIEHVRGIFGLQEPVYDLSSWGESDTALEGTGSLVLDRSNHIAYMGLSKRADKNIGELWAREMGYELVSFHTSDRSGEEIYHTNVLMSVGLDFAVLCTEAINDVTERRTVLSKLSSTNKTIVEITLTQMENFAGNCIHLRGEHGTVLAISAAGWASLDNDQRRVIESHVDQVVTSPVPTIERLGGGSVRCMIGELFSGALSEAEAIPSIVSIIPCESTHLKLVLVHEPGMEVDAVMPWTTEPMKVEECFNRVELKREHRDFVNLLRSHGSKVLHVRDLVKEVAHHGQAAKRQLFEIVWGREFVERVGLDNLTGEQLIAGCSKGPLDFQQPPLVNLFFMRDPCFSVPGGWVVISRPSYPIRQMESRLLKAIFKLHPAFRGVRVFEGLMDDPEVTIEGGDVLIADSKTVLVGVSQRTNEKGADRLAEFLFANTPVTRVVKVFIPRQRAFMHLDTLFTFVDKGVVLTMPYFWSEPEVYAEVARRANALNKSMGSEQFQDPNDWVKEPPRIEVIMRGQALPKKYKQAMIGLRAEGIIDKAIFVCGREGSWPTPAEHVMRALTEQWNDAANVFCIAPGVVLAYKWCSRTVTHLQDNGVDVIELDGVELMRGRGGPRCMTMPLIRTEI